MSNTADSDEILHRIQAMYDDKTLEKTAAVIVMTTSGLCFYWNDGVEQAELPKNAREVIAQLVKSGKIKPAN